MDLIYIKELLVILSYKEVENNIWSKNYNGYTICIDFNKEKIIYQDKNYINSIKLGDETTSNFENSENFVVLECVDRLLEKGYLPENITLEKSGRWVERRKVS